MYIKEVLGTNEEIAISNRRPVHPAGLTGILVWREYRIESDSRKPIVGNKRPFFKVRYIIKSCFGNLGERLFRKKTLV